MSTPSRYVQAECTMSYRRAYSLVQEIVWQDKEGSNGLYVENACSKIFVSCRLSSVGISGKFTSPTNSSVNYMTP